MTSDYERFQWHDTGRGSWAREVDEPEIAYTALYKTWRGCGRSFFHMTGHISLRVAVQDLGERSQVERKLETALAKAWTALRYHHPTIASQVKRDPATTTTTTTTKKRWIKEYPVSADGWLEETFKVVSVGKTGVEWANDDPPAPPHATMNVIVPPTSRDEDEHVVRRDLVFRSLHDIIDGIGTLMLFNNYIQLASEAYDQGDSYQAPSLDDPQVIDNLSPPYRVAAAVPPQPSETVKGRLAKMAAAEEADKNRNAEIVTLPFRKGALLPGVHKRVEILLAPEQTAMLTAACKSAGATVTHVFHAAIAMVLRDLQIKSALPRAVEYVGYLLRNERPNCKAPYNDHRYAASVYHSTSGDKLIIQMTVPSLQEDMEGPSGLTRSDMEHEKKEEFLRIVKQMRDFYIKVRDDEDHYRLAPLLWARRSMPPPEDEQYTPPVPGPSDAPSASISSMGRIDNIIAQQHGQIEVYSPWVTGEELRNGLGLFLGTFRGQMSLSAAYNDAWHDEGEALEFLRKCIAVVNMGFGL